MTRRGEPFLYHKDTVMDRLSYLRDKIKKAKQAYYYGGNPIMTDAEYDVLERELRQFNPNDPLLLMTGAPVPPDHILERAEHSFFMHSLDNAADYAEFAVWYFKYRGQMHLSLKGDGGSAAAYYQDGELISVVSRGDGWVGENITSNAVNFKNLPTVVGHNFTGCVRFEAILTKEDWAIADPSMASNPRNVGNGIMGRKDGYNSHLISAFALDTFTDQIEFSSYSDKFEYMANLGFTPIQWWTCHDLKTANNIYEEVLNNRPNLDFWIDGIVARIDAISVYKEHGFSGGRPRTHIAWKFLEESVTTRLIGVTITGGHTGAIIPTAVLEPVRLGGTTVQKALLNNWNEIERLDVAIGDTVNVIKSKDIIPKIVGVAERPAARMPILEPPECPFCGGETRRQDGLSGGGAVTMCINGGCPAKMEGKINKWVNTLDVLGIGDAVLNAMISKLGVSSPADLYRLTKDQLSDLIINDEKDIRLGEKRAEGILGELESKKSVPLHQFLGALGIPFLGQRRAELINEALGFSTLDQWLTDEILQRADEACIPNIARSIYDGLQNSRALIDDLLLCGITIKTASAAAGATVCITGKLSSGRTKGEYEQPLMARGWQLVDSVTKDLDYLVVADPSANTNKTQKAKKYGVKIISEEELINLIEDA